MDTSELQDHEIAALAKVWAALQQKYMRKPNTRAVLQELAKEAHDEFLKIGLVVDVKWLNNLMIDPKAMQPYPIEIEVIGRVPGIADPEGFDHEKKRSEVLLANERGEKYLGQKGPSTH